MSILAREPAEVVAVFKGGQAKPVRFRVGGRTYDVRSVDLVFSEQKGREKVHYFCVSDGTNAFRLAYSGETLAWHLETEERML